MADFKVYVHEDRLEDELLKHLAKEDIFRNNRTNSPEKLNTLRYQEVVGMKVAIANALNSNFGAVPTESLTKKSVCCAIIPIILKSRYISRIPSELSKETKRHLEDLWESLSKYRLDAENFPVDLEAFEPGTSGIGEDYLALKKVEYQEEFKKLNAEMTRLESELQEAKEGIKHGIAPKINISGHEGRLELIKQRLAVLSDKNENYASKLANQVDDILKIIEATNPEDTGSPHTEDSPRHTGQIRESILHSDEFKMVFVVNEVAKWYLKGRHKGTF